MATLMIMAVVLLSGLVLFGVVLFGAWLADRWSGHHPEQDEHKWILGYLDGKKRSDDDGRGELK